MRNSVVFYRNFRDALSRLPDTERLEAYEILFNYALDDTPIPYSIAGAFVQTLVPLIDKNNKRYENGKKGGRPPKHNQTETKQKPSGNQSDAKAEPDETYSVIVLESNSEIEEKSNRNKSVIEPPISPNGDIPPKGKRFTPPTVEEVEAYCFERNNRVDAEKFVDYYNSNGWRVGRNPMKDWKAAVRTWERNDTERKQANVTRLTAAQAHQREIDNVLDQIIGGAL